MGTGDIIIVRSVSRRGKYQQRKEKHGFVAALLSLRNARGLLYSEMDSLLGRGGFVTTCNPMWPPLKPLSGTCLRCLRTDDYCKTPCT